MYKNLYTRLKGKHFKIQSVKRFFFYQLYRFPAPIETSCMYVKTDDNNCNNLLRRVTQ